MLCFGSPTQDLLNGQQIGRSQHISDVSGSALLVAFLSSLVLGQVVLVSGLPLVILQRLLIGSILHEASCLSPDHIPQRKRTSKDRQSHLARRTTPINKTHVVTQRLKQLI